MALLFDGAKEATATTGTGTVTLGGAPPGFTQFSDFDLCTDGCLVHYVIEDGTSREVGIGTWNTGNTLSRTTIHNTLVGTTVTENPGTGLNLSGSAVVFSAVTADAGNDIDVTRYPVVRPSLNLDFANSEQVDPRITFVRDTTATRFNELGLLELVDANEPRIDYDPVTGECLGLLVEEQRINVVWYNRDLTNAVWSATNCTVAKTQTGIDGVANSCSLLTATAADATCLQTITLSSSARYQTAYIKRSVGTGNVFMTMDNGTTWTDITASINSTTFTRVSIPTQTIANPIVGFKIATNTDAIIVDFVQNENGTFATSAIETAGSAVTRNADVASMTGTNFSDWYRQDEGSFYFEIARTGAKSNNTVLMQVNDGTANNVIFCYIAATALDASTNLSIVKAGVSQAVTTVLSSNDVDVFSKILLSYKKDDVIQSVDSVLSSVDSAAEIPTVNKLTLYKSVGAGGTYDYHIKSLSYYPVRLSNSELQAITS